MPPKKKKANQDDVDPKILRKIKEPKLDPIDLEDEDEEDEGNLVIDDEKPRETEEESY